MILLNQTRIHILDPFRFTLLRLAQIIIRMLHARPCMAEAGQSVCVIARAIIKAPKWINPDTKGEIRVDTRVLSEKFAIVLLKKHPGYPRS